MATSYEQPTYSLEILKEHIRANRYVIRQVAIEGAAELYLAEDDIKDCVLDLDDACFHKTMDADKAPGLMQDVYKTRYAGFRIYLKLQMGYSKQAVVIQFKKDQSS